MPDRELLDALVHRKAGDHGYRGKSLSDWRRGFRALETQFFLRCKPEGKAGQRLGSATETYYEELPTIPPVVCNRLHEYRRLEPARGTNVFQISFSLIPLDLGPSPVRSGRTVPRVVRLLDGGKAYGGRT